MIIKLTQAEIQGFVAVALSLNPARFTIEISDDLSRETADILHALRSAVSAFPLHHSIQKISCIKMFRACCPKSPGYNGELCCVVGLADCKWAVENVADAIRNLETTGKIR